MYAKGRYVEQSQMYTGEKDLCKGRPLNVCTRDLYTHAKETYIHVQNDLYTKAEETYIRRPKKPKNECQTELDTSSKET